MLKVTTVNRALKFVQDGMTIMIGGDHGKGAPGTLITALVGSTTKNLTAISCDVLMGESGLGKLVSNKQLKKVIASNSVENQAFYKRMNASGLAVELLQKEILAERICAGGSSFAKPMANSPLTADIALIKADLSDKAGNLRKH